MQRYITVCALVALLGISMQACQDLNTVATPLGPFYNVGGKIEGASGPLTVSCDTGVQSFSGSGTFTCGGIYIEDANYLVEVITAPSGQTCNVVDGAGKVAKASIMNVSIVCVVQAPDGNNTVSATPTPSPTPSPSATPIDASGGFAPSGGNYRIVARGSGLALGVSGSVTNGTLVGQWTPDGDADQLWHFVLQPNNNYNIVHVGSQKCADIHNNVDTDGAVIELWDCIHQANQMWTFAVTSGELFNIVGDTGRCLDILDNSTQAGAQAISRACVNDVDQAWAITYSP